MKMTKTVILLCDDADKWIFQYGLSRSNNVKYCGSYINLIKKINDIGKMTFILLWVLLN
jgi:hypothetical protein